MKGEHIPKFLLAAFMISVIYTVFHRAFMIRRLKLKASHLDHADVFLDEMADTYNRDDPETTQPADESEPMNESIGKKSIKTTHIIQTSVNVQPLKEEQAKKEPINDLSSNVVESIEKASEPTQIESKGVHIEGSGCHGPIEGKWTPPQLPSLLQNVSQESEELARHICEQWLIPPFNDTRKLIWPDRTHYSQAGQDEIVDEVLKGKRHGFFIESGAANGEALSNSLFFEKTRGWSGLLVEANPKQFLSVVSRHRHAYMVNSCLSPVRTPIQISFRMAGYIGGMVDYMGNAQKERIDGMFEGKTTEIVNVQCFPLYSILKALGRTHVDYFSLDIEGAELDVLYTLPLDKITVEVFSIEYVTAGKRNATLEKLSAITELLVDKYGYKVLSDREGGDVLLQRGS